MKIITNGILFSILAVQVITESCQFSKELETSCGNYCFRIVKPLLEHTKSLQTQVDRHLIEKKLENQIEQTIEKKFEDLRETIVIRKAPAGGGPFQKIASKYYYIEQSQKLNWFEAAHKCLALGGHLVSIKNETEFNAIVENLQTNQNYWIDLNDLGSEGVFLSISTGLRAIYYNWHEGNPSNSNKNEDCGELHFSKSKFLMNDNNCDVRQFFICEPFNQ